MMTLTQSIGVIMGANIGSTITAQLLAFNLSAYALLPVAVGFFMFFAARNERMRQYGMMVMGLGLVFYGMGLMSDSMKPLRAYAPFIQLLQTIERPLGGILAGAFFTALVQSSAATIGIAIALAAEGLLSLQGGILLALGANIGTCGTALLAAIGKPTEAVRAAVVHLSFNVLGVLLWLPMLRVLEALAVWMSPASEGLETAARMAVEVPRQIANANTLFNVFNTVVFIGFTGLFARLAERLVPERTEPTGVLIKPKFLNEAALEIPSLALQRVRLEFGRVGVIAVSMLEEIGLALRDRDLARCEEIVRRDEQVDLLEASILEYLARIRQRTLTEEESLEHQHLMTAIVNLENLAGVVETNLVGLVRKVGERPLPRDELAPFIEGLYQTICRAAKLAVQAVQDNDQNVADNVLAFETTVRDQVRLLAEAEATRLGGRDSDLLRLTRLRMEAAGNFQRIYDLSCRIAKTVVPTS
jgi:phosphate:Na+ symporter